MEPRPLTPQDHEHRIDRLKEEMAARKIGAAYLVPSPDLAYFTGHVGVQSDRLLAFIVPLDGRPGLVVPSFEAPRLSGLPGNPSIIAWEEHHDPIALGLDYLEGKTGASPRIALEPATTFETAWKLMEAGMGRFVVEVGDPLFSAIRRRKDALEQAIITEAMRLTHEAMEQVWARVREGMSESEIAALLQERFQRLNPGSRSGGLVQVGPSSALPHGAPGERILKENDVLLIDCGTMLHGYYSDITRTVVYGKATPRFREVYRTVGEAQLAGAGTLSPGTPCEEADRAARRVIIEAGFGEFFTHRLGHGIGLEGHERPYLAEGNTTPLAEGDAVTVEPGIYLPGAFGVRTEDVAVVTATGFAYLCERPAELKEIG